MVKTHNAILGQNFDGKPRLHLHEMTLSFGTEHACGVLWMQNGKLSFSKIPPISTNDLVSVNTLLLGRYLGNSGPSRVRFVIHVRS